MKIPRLPAPDRSHALRGNASQDAVRPLPNARKDKTPTAFAIGVSEFNLDDDLLSHGETPHYHRRCIVSLLSSGWDQVVPMLYGRQEIL